MHRRRFVPSLQFRTKFHGFRHRLIRMERGGVAGISLFLRRSGHSTPPAIFCVHRRYWVAPVHRCQRCIREYIGIRFGASSQRPGGWVSLPCCRFSFGVVSPCNTKFRACAKFPGARGFRRPKKLWDGFLFGEMLFGLLDLHKHDNGRQTINGFINKSSKSRDVILLSLNQTSCGRKGNPCNRYICRIHRWFPSNRNR